MPIIEEATQSNSKIAPYWERNEPVVGEFGYTGRRTDGGTYIAARLSVYDDRENVGQEFGPQIHVQVRTTGKDRRSAVLHFKTLSEFTELVNDLTAARDAMADDAAVGVPADSEVEALSLD